MAVDTERVSAASDAVVSRGTHKNSECVPTVVPKLAAAPQAASEVVQPRPPDSGCTDILPLVGECQESLGLDTLDAVGPVEFLRPRLTLALIRICYRQQHP